MQKKRRFGMKNVIASVLTAALVLTSTPSGVLAGELLEVETEEMEGISPVEELAETAPDEGAAEDALSLFGEDDADEVLFSVSEDDIEAEEAETEADEEVAESAVEDESESVTDAEIDEEDEEVVEAAAVVANSATVEGIRGWYYTYFTAQLTGASVNVAVPSFLGTSAAYMQASYVDATGYEEQINADNYGKVASDVKAIEITFLNKRGKVVKAGSVGAEIQLAYTGAESYVMYQQSRSSIKQAASSDYPYFSFNINNGGTYVFAGLTSDGVERAEGVTSRGRMTFGLRRSNGMFIHASASSKAFSAASVSMEAENALTEETVVAAMEAVEKDAVVTEVVQAMDISFHDQETGEEIEPNQNVTLTVNADLDSESEYRLIHIPDVGEPEIVENAVFDENGVTFTTSEFSVYVIVKVEIDVEAGTYEAENSGIKVTVNTEKGTFDESVILTVAAISADSADYAVAEEELEKIGHTYEGMVAFDIHFQSKATGAEVEPNIPVDVQIEIVDPAAAGVPAEAVGAVTIAHIFDQGGAEIVSEPEHAEQEYVDEEAAPVNEFEAWVFSTYTISWTTGNWWDQQQHNVDIHYVDTAGNSLTPTMTPTFTNNTMFLIYDIDGYEYDSTHYGSRTGTSITPLLRRSNGDYDYRSGNSWNDLREDVYVVYKAKPTPSTGGTPVVDQDEEWPAGNDAPQFGKSSKNNGDGTNTITLSISATEKPVEKSTPADVIVIFDRSRSMQDNNLGNQTRLQAAKNAVNTMANTLMSNNSNVRMALISFSTAAVEVQEFTDSLTSFTNSVNGLSGDGGTNWEQALKIANEMDVRENAATFVVFVTDGDPTFRISRGDVADGSLDVNTDQTYQYYSNNHVFGMGYNDNSGLNFDFAVDQVTAIAGANKNFYAIGISNDVTKVRNLTTQGGVAADHAFIASDSAAMEHAFSSITESIKSMLGFGDIEITDGITELTNAEMKVMETVDPTSFTYWRYGGGYGADEASATEWTTRAADGCAPATYNESNGAVEWNMGEGFQLEAGVTYLVKFMVWPSQDAYDLVADLNNGTETYAGLTDEEKEQVVEIKAPTATEPGKYALRTNTDNVTATYKKTTETGGTVVISDDQPITATYHEGDIQDMLLDDQTLDFKKIWNNALDERAAQIIGEDESGDPIYGITLSVKRKNYKGAIEDFYSVDVRSDTDPAWEYKDLFVSCGNLVRNGNTVTLHEYGYDYYVEEPAEYSYYWELDSDIYRPMMINNEPTLLKQTDKPDAMTGDYYNDGSTEYYKILDSYYEVIPEGENAILTATNNRRSNLNLTKALVGTAPEHTQFTYNVSIKDFLGDDVWFSVMSDVENEEYVYPSVVQENGFTISDNVDLETRTAELFTYDSDTSIYKFGTITYTYDGKSYTRPAAESGGQGGKYFTGACSVPSETAFTIGIEAGWNMRVLNLPTGTTFDITEGTTSGFALESINMDVEGQSAADVGDPEISGANIKGSIDLPNLSYTVTYTNKCQFFYVYHSSDNSIERIAFTDARVVDGKFNIVNEVKTKYIYGGYYQAYTDAKKTSAEIGNLEYTVTTAAIATEYNGNHTGGSWYNDADTAGYTGKPGVWNAADAHTDKTRGVGNAMTPEPGGVYYLKEVPDTYLWSSQFQTFKVPTDELYEFYLVTAVDDANYREVGFVVREKEGSSTVEKTVAGDLYDQVKIAYPAPVVEDPDKVEEINIEDVNGYNADGYIVMKKHDVTIGCRKNIRQYFITPDGVRVQGIVQRITEVSDTNSNGIIEQSKEITFKNYTFSPKYDVNDAYLATEFSEAITITNPKKKDSDEDNGDDDSSDTGDNP